MRVMPRGAANPDTQGQCALTRACCDRVVIAQ